MRWGVFWTAVGALAAVATVSVMVFEFSDQRHAPKLTAVVTYGPIMYPPDVLKLIQSAHPPGEGPNSKPAAGYFHIHLENSGNDTAEKIRLYVPGAEYFAVESETGGPPAIYTGSLFKMVELAPHQQQDVTAYAQDEPRGLQAEGITFSYKAGDGKVLVPHYNQTTAKN